MKIEIMTLFPEMWELSQLHHNLRPYVITSGRKSPQNLITEEFI